MKILVAGDPKFRDVELVTKVLSTICPGVLVHPGFEGPLSKAVELWAKYNGSTVLSYPLRRFKDNGYLSPFKRNDAMLGDNIDIGLCVFFGTGDAAGKIWQECKRRSLRCFVLHTKIQDHEVVVGQLREFETGHRKDRVLRLHEN